MALPYGLVKSRVKSVAHPVGKPQGSETQYHLHIKVEVDGDDWDVAINVGTNDSDDLMTYKLVYDFHHAIIGTLKAAAPGLQTLTGQAALPALDFVRSDILDETGNWRDSDVMDGSEAAEPIPTLKRLLIGAQTQGQDIYIWGRLYQEGDGMHDIHMNQGSSGNHFRHVAGVDEDAHGKFIDHNDIWQDGAIVVDTGNNGWAAFFTRFNQQSLDNDDLGNPKT